MNNKLEVWPCRPNTLPHHAVTLTQQTEALPGLDSECETVHRGPRTARVTADTGGDTETLDNCWDKIPFKQALDRQNILAVV